MLSTTGSFLHLAVNGIILESSNKMTKATKSSFEIHGHDVLRVQQLNNDKMNFTTVGLAFVHYS